jgi:ComEC/Rec2-related protein
MPRPTSPANESGSGLSSTFEHAGDADAPEVTRGITSPALFLALALALGIALSGSLDARTATLLRALPLLIAAAAASLLGAALLVRAGRYAAAAAVVLAGFTLAGAALPVLFASRFPPNHVSRLEEWGFDLDRPVRVEGSILTEPISTPSGIEFDLGAARLLEPGPSPGVAPPARAVSGKIRVLVESFARTNSASEGQDLFSLRPGDVISAGMLLRRPRVYQNPGSFDFRRRAADMEDLYWEGSVNGTGDIRRLASPSGFDLGQTIWRVRRRVRRGIDRIYPPWSAEGRDGAVLKAILLGERSSLDSATVDHFRASGLYHLLVIAGLHVGLIAGLVLGFLRLIGLRRTWRNTLLLAILLGYSVLVEQRAPTLRATLMIVAFVLADLLNRDHAALNSVGLAALILLLARPAWLFESGFQLSFAAALLIVGLAGPLIRMSVEPYRRALAHLDNVDMDVALRPRLAQFRLDLRSLVSALRGRSAYLDRHPLAATRLLVWPLGAVLRLVEIAALSAVLQIGLLLPMVQTFHRVTLAGIGLNTLALPLMAVLLAIAIPTVALAAVAPSWAVVPARILAVVFKGLFRLAELPHLPAWLSYRVPSPPLAVAIGFALSLIVLALSIGRARALAIASAVAFAVCAFLLTTAPFAADLPSGSFELTALDCGRGQAGFVVLGGGATMLIGAGGVAAAGSSAPGARWDPGENIVAPYLWSRRVKSLDVLVATGRNLDGVTAILDDFHVRELWLAPQGREPDASALAAVTARCRQRGVNVRQLADGEVLQVESATVQVLGRYGNAASAEPGETLTLRIAEGGSSALFLGGVSSEARQSPADSALPDPDADFRGELLIIDRPSLATAARSNLLASIGAQVAIDSPGPTVREDLESRRALSSLDLEIRVLETDTDGAVTATIEGGSIGIRTFRSGGRSGVGGPGGDGTRGGRSGGSRRTNGRVSADRGESARQRPYRDHGFDPQRQVLFVVTEPDQHPALAFVNAAGAKNGRFHAQGGAASERRIDFLARLHLDRDDGGLGAIVDRHLDAIAHVHRLRAQIIEGRDHVLHASRDGLLVVFGRL